MVDTPRMLELRRRIQADPASIAFAQLAEECRRLGSNEEAAEICRAGLARHPGYLSARVTLGRALIELGQLDAAKAELEIVVAGVPDNLAAIRGLAEILQRQGQLPEALRYYRRALDLAKHDRDLEATVERISQKVAPAPQTAGPQVSIEEIFNFDKLIDQLGLPPEESASAPSASEGRQAAVLEDILTVGSPASEDEAEAPVKLEPEAPFEDLFAVESPASEGQAEAPVMLESVELPASEGGFADPAAEPSSQSASASAAESGFGATASAFAAEGRYGATAPELASETLPSGGGPELADDTQASGGGPELASDIVASEGGPVPSLEELFAEPIAEPAIPDQISPPPEVSAYAAEGGFGEKEAASLEDFFAEESPASEGGAEAPTMLDQAARVEDLFAVESPAITAEGRVGESALASVELTLDDADSLAVMERGLRELEQQRAADERSARVELAQRRRAAMVFALETWLSAIVADRERAASA